MKQILGVEKHGSEMPHKINHSLRYVCTTRGWRENRLRVTIPKLLIFGPEILLNSLHWHCPHPSPVWIMAGQSLHGAPALPGSFQPKQIWDPGGTDVFGKSTGWPSGRLSSVPSSACPTKVGECWGGNSGQRGKIAGMTNAWDD